MPGSNDELDKLVKQCEAAAEAGTVAKRNGDKPRIDADVKALVALKEQITAIAPDHPLALKDKKKAKKGGTNQAADPNKPLSKNAQKASPRNRPRKPARPRPRPRPRRIKNQRRPSPSASRRLYR